MRHAAYVFDAYGTLFDVHAAARRHAEAIGPDFRLLVGDLARQAARILLGADADGRLQRFLGAYRRGARLRVAPSCPRRRRAAGRPARCLLAARLLPGGAVGVEGAEGGRRAPRHPLQRLACRCSKRRSRRPPLDQVLDAVFSVDAVRRFKTDPAVYHLVADRLAALPGRGLLSVLQPLGHRRRRAVRLPHRVDQPQPASRTSTATFRPALILPSLPRVCSPRLRARRQAVAQPQAGRSRECHAFFNLRPQRTTLSRRNASWKGALRTVCAS